MLLLPYGITWYLLIVPSTRYTKKRENDLLVQQHTPSQGQNQKRTKTMGFLDDFLK